MGAQLDSVGKSEEIPNVSEELLTVSEVAQRLKLNQQKIRNYIDAGRLSAVRVGSRRVPIRREDSRVSSRGRIHGRAVRAGLIACGCSSKRWLGWRPESRRLSVAPLDAVLEPGAGEDVGDELVAAVAHVEAALRPGRRSLWGQKSPSMCGTANARYQSRSLRSPILPDPSDQATFAALVIGRSNVAGCC